jgi:hypothetical protein
MDDPSVLVFPFIFCGGPIITVAIVLIIVFIWHKSKINNQNFEYKQKYIEWQKLDYYLKNLDAQLKSCNGNQSREVLKFIEFEKKITNLNTLIEEVKKLDLDFYPPALSALLKQPDKLKEIEDYVAKIKDDRINLTKNQRLEIKNLSETVMKKNKELLDKATSENNESLLSVSAVLTLEADKLIRSYQLGDVQYSEVGQDLKKMLSQIEKLLSGPRQKTKPNSNINGSYYDILRVKKDATFEEIKYFMRAAVLSNQNNEEELKKINLAYDTLSDPEKRAKYDRVNP